MLMPLHFFLCYCCSRCCYMIFVRALQHVVQKNRINLLLVHWHRKHSSQKLLLFTEKCSVKPKLWLKKSALYALSVKIKKKDCEKTTSKIFGELLISRFFFWLVIISRILMRFPWHKKGNVCAQIVKPGKDCYQPWQPTSILIEMQTNKCNSVRW